MANGKRVGFLLDESQIRSACEAFIAGRLQSDEAGSARLVVSADDDVHCEVSVSKKRKPREKKPKGGGAGGGA